VGITGGSREVPGRNACDKRHPYPIIIMKKLIIIMGNSKALFCTSKFS
jgi:hypothetical protein